MTDRITGGDAVHHALRALGVDVVFGIPSVHNLPIYDAIGRHGEIRAIGVRHEQGALHAADGYARATGRLGVAITSTGPGATNAMTGLFEAGFASSRVLMLTGQVETRFYGKGKGVLHEAENQLRMLRTVTREAASVASADRIAETIVRLGSNVLRGRPQPAAIEIPVDLQYAEGPYAIPTPDLAPGPLPADEAIAAAVETLRDSQRTLIWAGGGAVTAEAAAALVQLAETLDAPVFTSINGRGVIPESHPLALGCMTAAAQFGTTFEQATCVLAVGTRFKGGATRNFELELGGRLIHVDADPQVIGRNYGADVAVVADARLALEAFNAHLGGDAPRNDAQFNAGALEVAAAVRERTRVQIGADHAAIMDHMRRALPDAANIVRDATIPGYAWGDRLIEIRRPRTSSHPASTAIGPGLPLAIGTAVGSGQVTALIQGDGGFMLNIGELATLKALGVPVIVCLFNDAGYGVLRMIAASTFDGRQIGVDLETPDFVKVAEGFGIAAERVVGVEAFEAAFSRAVASAAPALLDIDATALAPISFG
jgi:acetolactate synthase-1/2/3 large subunit